MNHDANELLNKEGLKFFGKVNASISHELKNILAIISETAGLLSDLTELARHGKQIELSMLENCSSNITEEIQRGFRTIKQMNRFAHSVDDFIKETDLLETLDLSIQLTGYLSFATIVQTDFKTRPEKPILTSPFLLQNLLYQVLCFAYAAVGHNGHIHIRCSSQDNTGIYLVFSSNFEQAFSSFPTQSIQHTADVLGAKLNTDSKVTELDVWIPYTNPQFISKEHNR